MTVVAEPAMRNDGTCALSGCKIKLPPLALAQGDPFHSMKCARKHYGVVFLSDTRKVRGS